MNINDKKQVVALSKVEKCTLTFKMGLALKRLMLILTSNVKKKIL